MEATETRTYNGWSNYETWCMALWIGNDQASYLHAQALAEAEVEVPAWTTRTEARTAALATALCDWQEELRPDLGATVFSDLLGAAFSEIDWYEIASSIISTEDE